MEANSVAIKSGNEELERMHKVYESMWKNEYLDFFKFMEYKWSPGVAEVMHELEEKVKADNIQLISYAYSSINENSFSEMTKQSPTEIIETCKRLGWQFEDHIIYPKSRLQKK